MKDIFVSTYDTRETSFSDQTGKFPKQSTRGHKHIMVLVKIDSNAILVEPMKSQKGAEMIRAYNVLVKRLQQMNIHPQNYVLDNKISDNMKQHIKTNYSFENGGSGTAGMPLTKHSRSSNPKFQGNNYMAPEWQRMYSI